MLVSWGTQSSVQAKSRKLGINMKKVTAPSLREMKRNGEKIVSLTAYDFLFASILEEVEIDVVLVGDSGAMVFSGHDSTLPITLDEMIYHVKAVRRGVERALLVADMPFLTYQVSSEQAIENAGRLLKEGRAECVKVEGGRSITETVKKIVDVGIPVMGHIGLTPQSVHSLGGYGVQGAQSHEAERLIDDARSLEQAGACAVVLEKIPAALAGKITSKLAIPTIGIGAGSQCDGQILVTHDMLGLFETFTPKFVRKYGELGEEVRKACRRFKEDVKGGRFPGPEESYS